MWDTKGSVEDLHDEHDEEKIHLDGDEEEPKEIMDEEVEEILSIEKGGMHGIIPSIIFEFMEGKLQLLDLIYFS
jgi:hypothetical protein